MASGKTIFLIEDDEEFRDLVKMRFEAAGHRVLMSKGGDETLDSIAESKPDLIVLDIFLPDVDGLTILKRLKADLDIASGKPSVTKNIPVIVVTGKAPMVESLTRIVGASDFFVKPVHVDQLIKRAQQLLAPARENEKQRS